MPKLLISVTTPAEALAAQSAGADIIDLKDPTQGPLGMARPQTIHAVCDTLCAPLSLALGELVDSPSLANLPPGIAFAKTALKHAPSHWPDLFRRTFAPRPDITPVLALYAPMDSRQAQALGPILADPFAAIAHAAHAGAKGILIDTFIKDGRSLLDSLYWPLLPQIIAHTRSQGLWIALAGSLKLQHIPQLLPLAPDILGFRGAACTGHNRLATLDPDKITALKLAASADPIHL